MSCYEFHIPRRDQADFKTYSDISRSDYTFTTQPGALRRVIMNLFGNSLKYTDKGTILIRLVLRDLDESERTNSDERMLELSIRDTGKGISSEYLRSKLFTPFSQEDTLATGVGLGLSIVKSIVTMLNGSIDIRSQLGEGTEVSVRIPLMRLPGTMESTPSTIASSSSMSTCVQALQSGYCDKRILLFGFHGNQLEALQARERARVLQIYITDWYGMSTTTSSSEEADLIVTDERDLPGIQVSTNHRKRPIVVLCGSSPAEASKISQGASIMEFVSRPFGPYKLAKAILACLEKVDGAKDGEGNATMIFPTESPIGSEADTIVPDDQGKSEREDFPFPQTLADNTEARTNKDADDSRKSQHRDPKQSTIPEQTDRTSETYSKPDLIRRDSRRPKLTQRVTEPLTNIIVPLLPPNAASSAVTETGAVATSTAAEPTAEIAAPTIAPQSKLEIQPPKSRQPPAPDKNATRHPPRLLLVDDNKINLRLLETFMKKRKYSQVDSAEDGQLAVRAAQALKEGYDIIFMGKHYLSLN